MPRKNTVQPEPLERFHLPDGTEVDIVDETCWPIGRGQHFAHQVASWGFLGEEGRDDSNVRKQWYVRIKLHFDALINAKNEADKGNTA